jgi:hypothetical protein
MGLFGLWLLHVLRTAVLRALCPVLQGVSTQFPGVLVGPPPVRKCHQMPPKEPMQLGWVVRWVLSTPPRPPHGWAVRPCGRVVPVLPLLLCTRPARARPSIGGQTKPPSRSALAPVGSSPGLVLSPVTVLQFSRFAPIQLELPNRDRDYVLPRGLVQADPSCSRRQTK